jgi:hypothetical protein
VAYLWLNNVAFPVARDSLRMTPEYVGEALGRSPNGGLLESSTGKNKRRWRFTSAPMSFALAKAWAHIVNGNGQSWSFTNGSLYSKKGVTVSAAGSLTTTVTGVDALSGTRFLEIASDSQFQVSLADKMHSIESDVWGPADGFTAVFWRENPESTDELIGGFDDWTGMCLTGTGTWTVGTPNPSNVTQYAALFGGAAAQSAFSMGYFTRMSAAGIFAVYAKAGDGGGASTSFVHYDEIMVLPFEIPSGYGQAWADAWIQLATNVSAPPLPRIYMSGDALGTTQYDVVEAIGRVVEVRQMGAAVGGASFAANVCTMEIELIEV